jgi:serine/threonine protein phosphatase PrpC
MLEGGKLICANVGDSRAVIGRESASRYKAIPLSIDHKPSLPLEYQRIAKAGGRVESYYDSDGI